MPDKQTLQDHLDDLLEEVSKLYDRIHRLEAQLDRANKRAEYWAKMYDELTEIRNTELDDDDEIDVNDE
jgi:predicted  nucleic acid-binding Zn-ribbon protein